jgi:ElaB/YqjD/DUF883 family membrane-anchored ribosome-binding protein
MDDRTRAHTQPLEDWITSETRDIADAARQRLDDAKRDAGNYAAQATEYVQHGMEQAREYAEGALRHARDTVAGYHARGTRVVTRDLPAYVREQPMAALLIAAGTGLVLGWLSGANNRR